MTGDNHRFDPWGRADQIIESIYTGRRSGHASDDVVVDVDDDDYDHDDDHSRKSYCCHPCLRTSRDTAATADCSSTSSIIGDYSKHVHFSQGDHSELTMDGSSGTLSSLFGGSEFAHTTSRIRRTHLR
mmetsp:Transcript_11699/g.25259  ORF Transcript_11699/g.25259 Transcript_11699/m.25259 type:complete len:128 (+) Transcript_11699:305-688(+)